MKASTYLAYTVEVKNPESAGRAGDTQLQATLAGLMGTGVIKVHLMWGRHELEGLPAELRAVVESFRSVGMTIVVHVMELDLWERTKGPWRRVHNANYFSALSAALQAAPGLPLLVLEDDVQLASFFALRLCRLLGQLRQTVRKAAGDAWAVDLMARPHECMLTLRLSMCSRHCHAVTLLSD